MLRVEGAVNTTSEEATAGLTSGTIKKYNALKAILREMGTALVAFSGGVDSSFLLRVASDELGANAVALTATSPTYLEDELREATELAATIGTRHLIVDSNELEIEGFADNSKERCYFCKSELFGICQDKARELGLTYVLDGTNTDDLSDYRPGSIAAKEKHVRSPLLEAKLNKTDIRVLSKMLALPTWDKPNLACLSSRFPYGTKITEKKLEQIAACESFLHGLGMRQLRVRYHGETARIELDIELNPEAINFFLKDENRKIIVAEFKKVGFTYVTLDLEGYRTGSMNEVLCDSDKNLEEAEPEKRPA